MSSGILSQDEISALVEDIYQQKHLDHLWEGEARDYDLIHSSEKNQQKLELLKGDLSLLLELWYAVLNQSLAKQYSYNLNDLSLANTAQVLQSFQASESIKVELEDQLSGNQGMLLISRKMMFEYYSKIMGGNRAYVKSSSLSYTEQKYFKILVDEMLNKIGFALRNIHNFEFKRNMDLLENTENIKYHFDCVRLTCQFVLEESSYPFELLLPKSILGFIGKTEESGQSQQADQEWINIVADVAMHIPYELNVNLGNVRIPLENIIQLKEGDVFPLVLDERGHHVIMNNKLRFFANLGRIGEHKAIKII